MKIWAVFLTGGIYIPIRMIGLDDQLREIQELFPRSYELANKKIEVPLFPEASLIVDFSRYPKKPKFTLPKQIARILGDLESFMPALNRWDKKNPPNLAPQIQYLKMSMETIAGVKVHLSEKILKDIGFIAQGAHPHEMFCLLRLTNGQIDEYVVAPGMEASETTAVFFPHRLGRDVTLVSTCHSHPSGNCRPSAADLQTFRQKPVNIISGYPYNVNNLGVYNMLGEPIPFEVHLAAEFD